MNFKVFLALSLLICSSFAGFLPMVYRQNDPRWKDTKVGFGHFTIAQKGDLICSLASIAGGLGFKYEDKLFNPNSMNQWLKDNKGFVQDDQVVWESLSPLGLDYLGVTDDTDEMAKALAEDKLLVLYIQGTHYVVGYGVFPGKFLIMDPSAIFDVFVPFPQVVRAYIYEFEHI